MSKKCLFCGLLCFVVALAPGAVKAGIIFDGNGSAPGGAVEIDGIDWAPGNGLSVGGSAAISTFIATGGGASGPIVGTVQTPFQLFFQSTLANTSFGGVINTPALGGQFTVVGAITEIVTTATGVGLGTSGAGSFATFDLAPVQAANYFEIYFDPNSDANSLTGTGFNSYAGVPAGGAAGTGTDVGLVADSNAIRILAGTVSDALVSTFFAGLPITNLDGFGIDNYPLNDSLFGSGATTLDILVNPFFVNPDFFRGTIDQFSFTTQAGVPFGFPGPAVDPSARFLTASTTTALGITPTIAGAGLGLAGIGSINGGAPGAGGGGPDFQLFVDGSSTIRGSIVPEPSSLAVFGVLAGIAALRQRRKVSLRNV